MPARSSRSGSATRWATTRRGSPRIPATAATCPSAPSPVITALAAALGVAVHLLLAPAGLVHDHEERERSLPLLVALRIGTPRLLLVAGVLAAVLVVAILVVGRSTGLT